MPYPTVRDSGGAARSIKTKSSSAAGSNADPDIPLVYVDSGENFIGQTGKSVDLIEVTPTLDTSAYAAGDVLFDVTAVTNAFRVSGGQAMLHSIVVLDKDDQGVEMDLLFYKANTSIGAFNSPPDPTDTESEDFIGHVNIATTDYIDLVANRVATKRGINLLLEPTTGTTLYIAGITRGGTPTHTAAGLKIKLGLERF